MPVVQAPGGGGDVGCGIGDHGPCRAGGDWKSVEGEFAERSKTMKPAVLVRTDDKTLYQPPADPVLVEVPPSSSS